MGDLPEGGTVQVDFRHKGCGVPEHLRLLAVERLEHLTQYLDDSIKAEVFFSQATNPAISEKHSCEVTLAWHGHVVRARACGNEQVQAFDRVEDKVRHQLEKLKGRLLLRSHPHHRPPKTPTSNGHGAPSITKTKRFEIADLNPEEAAFKMDMLSHSFYLFQNAETGSASVVYRRDDGSVGLIDTDT